jgi:hypothetical protein
VSRRTVWRIALAAAGLWAVAAGLLVVSSAVAARRGQAAVRSAQKLLTATDIADVHAPDRLEPVRRDFSTAHSELTNPIVAPLRVIPVVGRQLRAISDLAGAATRVAVVGQSTVLKARAALTAPHRTGAQRLAAIRTLAAAASGAGHALDQINLGPGTKLIGPVGKAYRDFDARLAKLRASLARGVAGANGAASLLAGPQHVLVLMANNAEMRDGSGTFLSAATLDTSDGSLHLGDIHSTADLAVPGAGVQPFVGDMADRWGWLFPNREWRNLGLTPRFDTTAPLAARMWKAVQGEDVSGVLGLDIETLKAVLVGTGPIQVDGQEVSANSVEQLLQHDQYVDLGNDANQADRRERLGHIASAAFRALQDGNFSVAHLATALSGITSGRHLLVWSKAPDEQREWEAAGVAGTVGPNDLLVGVSNRGANKLDQFLDVSNDLAVRPGLTGTDVTVTVHLANQTPDGEPPYVIDTDPSTGLHPGDYFGFVSVSMPGSATGVVVDGFPQVSVYGPDGQSLVVAVLKGVLKGQTAVVVVHFRLPGPHGAMIVLASARVPAARWTLGRVRWRDDDIRVVRW